MMRIETDFDTGSLNSARSKIERNRITLEPMRVPGEWEKGDYGWFHFKLSGDLKGKALEFILPMKGSFSRFHKDQRFVFSYDQNRWFFFDNGAAEDGFYHFSHNSPFSSDEVFIAYGLPYTTKRIERHIERIKGSPWVFKTPSCISGLVLGMTPGATGGANSPRDGRKVPALELFGYRISDSAACGDKKTVVLSGGNHPGETVANYVLEGMVDFLISDDPAAASLRKKADCYVYPCTNPEGRYAGYFRSNPENPSLDHNRHWKDSTGFTDIEVIKQAMLRDTGGGADYFIDFHGQMKSLRFEVWVLKEIAECMFMRALLKREPGLYIRKRPGSATGCRTWSMSQAGLKSPLSFTPEIPFIPGVQPEGYLKHGKDYGLALADALT